MKILFSIFMCMWGIHKEKEYPKKQWGRIYFNKEIVLLWRKDETEKLGIGAVHCRKMTRKYQMETDGR